MITKSDIEVARKNWLTASRELGFEIITPYDLEHLGGTKKVFAYLPHLGSEKGMYLELVEAPEFHTDEKLLEVAKTAGIFCSFINVERYLEYKKKIFEETIEDWNILP